MIIEDILSLLRYGRGVSGLEVTALERPCSVMRGIRMSALEKDGREDPLDALRYDCIMFNWHDTMVDRRQYQPRPRAGGGVNSRRVKVGGSKTRSF